MIVDTTVVVRLTDDEVKCLEQARRLIEQIYENTRNCECEVQFESNVVYDTLFDIQSSIQQIL